MVVLGSLLGSMAIGSGLLLLLEPTKGEGGPLVRSAAKAPLFAIGEPSDPADRIFHVEPEPAPHRWTSIVIRCSGGSKGSAALLDDVHQRAGLGDLAYHFVIGNGNGAADGDLQMGPRWVDQRPGYTAMALHNHVGARQVIDICLVGDWDRTALTDKQRHYLVWLVRQLQQRLNIPADAVLVGDGYTSKTGRLFPTAWFRQQLMR